MVVGRTQSRLPQFGNSRTFPKMLMMLMIRVVVVIMVVIVIGRRGCSNVVVVVAEMMVRNASMRSLMRR